jgi:hypothetical protein
MTREHRDADGIGQIIENPTTRRIAELFNGVYATVLQLLLQYFSHGGESPAQRAALKAAAGRLMSVAIRPIAEVLTTSPFAAANDPRRAGPPFELYADVSLSPFPDARWTMLLERLDAIVAEATELQQAVPRLGSSCASGVGSNAASRPTPTPTTSRAASPATLTPMSTSPTSTGSSSSSRQPSAASTHPRSAYGSTSCSTTARQSTPARSSAAP